MDVEQKPNISIGKILFYGFLFSFIAFIMVAFVIILILLAYGL